MVYLIAEVGINHGGKAGSAKAHLHEAKRAGADCVKFQLFRAETLVSKVHAPEQYEFFKKHELTFREMQGLYEEAKSIGIDFLCTPFDVDAVSFLDSLPVTRFKVASGDITNEQLLLSIGAKRKPVFLSTGMATIPEIRWALDKLMVAGANEVTLLHCVSLYPTPLPLANLRAIETLIREFNLPVGYSDHTEGIACAVSAVALGAKVVEKHFAIDKSRGGPDTTCSANPDEFALLRRMSDEVAVALGNGEKVPSDQELSVARFARRSLYARKRIEAGEIPNATSIIPLRPVSDVPAIEFSRITSEPTQKRFLKGDPISR